MDVTTLAAWRDASLILLSIEAIILGIVPLVIAFYMVRGTRALNRRVRVLLVSGRVWALRIQQGTTRTMDAVASVPITIATRTTHITATTRGVVNFLLGR